MIYVDHNATSPLHPEALSAMLPFLENEFGNPSSIHALGAAARDAVEFARREVAGLFGTNHASVVFTSGGTESNNAALLALLPRRGAGRVITTPIEHASVLSTLGDIEGPSLEFVSVDSEGLVDLDDLRRLLQQPANLVSIGWANNEVGTVQPMAAISEICRSAEVALHSDAVQAAGKLAVDAGLVDALSISAHKLGGPKGVGALVLRSDAGLRPLIRGGAQERERRAGTENVPGIVGFGAACAIRRRTLGDFRAHVAALRKKLSSDLCAVLDGVRQHGPADDTGLPNTLNVRFEGVRGEALVAALDMAGVAVSSGSACAAGAAEPSHVLVALGLSADQARDGVRYSIGATNSAEEIDTVVHASAEAVRRIRSVRAVA